MPSNRFQGKENYWAEKYEGVGRLLDTGVKAYPYAVSVLIIISFPNDTKNMKGFSRCYPYIVSILTIPMNNFSR